MLILKASRFYFIFACVGGKANGAFRAPYLPNFLQLRQFLKIVLSLLQLVKGISGKTMEIFVASNLVLRICYKFIASEPLLSLDDKSGL